MLRRSIRSLSISFACAGLLALTLGVSVADAETKARLAPPGPCAEPREAVTGVVPGNGATAAAVGSLAALLSPTDVAAAPVKPARARPSPSNAPTPGSCDVLASACTAETVRVPIENPPISGGPGRGQTP